MSPKRRKNPADEWMPPRVYKGKSAYEWHPKGGGSIRLCPLSASKEDVQGAYRRAKAKHEHDKRVTVGKMLDLYFASQDFSEKSKATRVDYRQSEKAIRKTFGRAMPDEVTAPIIRKYMDLRGAQSKVRANREKALLSTAWAWNFERGHIEAKNPCTDVKPFKETGRERYVEDTEYQAVYDLAPVTVQIAMEIAYLCGARQGDVLDVRWGQKGQTVPEKGQNAVVLEQGIYIRQGKTGKRQVKLWSPRLRAAISAAKGLQADISSVYVIHNRKGQRYTASGFKAMWRKVLKQWLGDGADKNHPHWFTFHDLKAKGISDYEAGDKQDFSGHANRAQMERYNRKIQQVKAHDPDRKPD